MAERDKGRRVVLFSDVPGDEERVREILAAWGVEERAINRLMREERAESVRAAAEQRKAPATSCAQK